MTEKDYEICGGKLRKRDGECKRPAGWGTSHPGSGKCKLHGGSTPSGTQAAIKARVTEMAKLTDGVPITPDEFLEQAIRIQNGIVSACTDRVNEFENAEDLMVETIFGQDWNFWVKARNEALKEGSRYAQIAISTGLDKRRTQVAEQIGTLIAGTIGAVLEGLQLSKDQQALVPDLLRENLPRAGVRALEAGEEQ